MTVAELIKYLETCPQEAEVEIEYPVWDCDMSEDMWVTSSINSWILAGSTVVLSNCY